MPNKGFEDKAGHQLCFGESACSVQLHDWVVQQLQAVVVVPFFGDYQRARFAPRQKNRALGMESWTAGAGEDVV